MNIRDGAPGAGILASDGGVHRVMKKQYDHSLFHEYKDYYPWRSQKVIILISNNQKKVAAHCVNNALAPNT